MTLRTPDPSQCGTPRLKSRGAPSTAPRPRTATGAAIRPSGPKGIRPCCQATPNDARNDLHISRYLALGDPGHRTDQQPPQGASARRRRPLLRGAPGPGHRASRRRRVPARRRRCRLMLELEHGRGVTSSEAARCTASPIPVREVGVLLGEVPGHPSRTVRGQLRMLVPATACPPGAPTTCSKSSASVGLRDQRLGTLSRGMDRRLGLAAHCSADPHTLVLDAPADGLSPAKARWLHGLLRAHAARGGAVLFTTDDAKEAARTADRVVTLEAGRLVADQEAAEFARTRLRPRVAVRSPARRPARLPARQGGSHRLGAPSRSSGRSGSRLSVYGSTCADSRRDRLPPRHPRTPTRRRDR